jgi:hypothetical protein
MIQVYCADEIGMNNWLKKNSHVEVIDIKMCMNEQGEYLMAIYRINE